jgi:hypothetical protein
MRAVAPPVRVLRRGLAKLDARPKRPAQRASPLATQPLDGW